MAVSNDAFDLDVMASYTREPLKNWLILTPEVSPISIEENEPKNHQKTIKDLKRSNTTLKANVEELKRANKEQQEQEQQQVLEGARIIAGVIKAKLKDEVKEARQLGKYVSATALEGFEKVLEEFEKMGI